MNRKCKPSSGTAVSYAPFTVCLFNGASLSYDGVGFTVTKPTIPDGVVSRVVVKDGCVIEYSGDRVPTYSPPTCVSSPEPCCSEGTTTAVNVSKAQGNTLSIKTDGLYASTSLKSGDGVTISGLGTPISPYNISIDTNTLSLPVVQSNNAVNIAVSYEGKQNAYRIDLPTKFTANQEYLGLTINDRGVITAINQDVAMVTSITALAPITANKRVDNSVQISLQVVEGLAGSYSMGAYTVTIGDSGIVNKLERTIDLKSDKSFVVHGTKYTIDQYGSIKTVAPAQASEVIYDNYASILSPIGGSTTTREFSATIASSGLYTIEVEGYFGASTANKPLMSTTTTVGVVGGGVQACFVGGNAQQITSVVATGVSITAGVVNFIITSETSDLNQSPLLVKITSTGAF